MKQSIKRLPDAELAVMQALWSSPSPAARTDLEKQLAQTHPMAQTTLLTLLSRLAEKGFIQVDKIGRASRFTPLVSRQEYLSCQSKRFLDQLCGGSIPAFAAALCDSGLTKEELQQLRDLLERDAL